MEIRPRDRSRAYIEQAHGTVCELLVKICASMDAIVIEVLLAKDDIVQAGGK